MKKVINITLFMLVSIYAMGQASGGQIKRSASKQNTNSAQKTAKPVDMCIVNGHKAVDLGLSVNWATCNVGASKPSEYGNYFAWGETKSKTDYSWTTYFDIGEVDSKIDLQKEQCGLKRNNFKKYTDIGKRVLAREDDAAYVKWGGTWRTPTYEEFEELWNLSHKWDVVNGIQGMRFTSSNGQSIFLPAAGVRKNKMNIEKETDGIYWTSELYHDDYDVSDAGYAWGFNKEGGGWQGYSRCIGFTIRPVTK